MHAICSSEYEVAKTCHIMSLLRHDSWQIFGNKLCSSIEKRPVAGLEPWAA